MEAKIVHFDPTETLFADPDAKDAKADVLLFVTTNVKLVRKRMLRFREAFLKADPNNRFVAVTFDHGAKSHIRQIDADGCVIEHHVFGAEDVTTFGYPNKGAAKPFKLIPGNSDLITLLFRKRHPQYRRYWFLEDDVEYTGDAACLFADLSKREGDLLATHLARGYSQWAYAGARRTPGCEPDDWLVFLPFYRVSASALDTIDAYYHKGWAGHHENLWPTILKHAGGIVIDIGGQGDYVAEADRNKHYYGHACDGYNKHGTFGTLDIRLFAGRRENVLWHPVKPFRNWARQRSKRFLSQGQWLCSRFGKALVQVQDVVHTKSIPRG